MKIAIIGCGSMANTHAAAATQLGKKIAIVVEPNAQAAQSFAAKWKAEKIASFEEALSPDIDAVHICTPPGSHYELALMALEAKKHVFCEKPLSPDPMQAKKLHELAVNNGNVTGVGFNVRYHEACGRAREVVSSKEFGAPLFIHGTYLQEFHALPAEHMWRYEPELAGPMRATTEIGSHVIDLMRFWTGLEITSVSANFACFDPERYLKEGVMHRSEQQGSCKIAVNSEDVSLVSLKFSNGAIGHMLLSEVSHGRSNYLKLEVSGTEKSVWWESENPYHLHTASKFAGVTDSVNAFGGGYTDTVRALLGEFYSAIEGSASRHPTFYDGYVNSLVCDAVFKSAKSGGAWTDVFA